MNNDRSDLDLDGAERRGSVRLLACIPADIELEKGTTGSALIRDLSPTGAQLLSRAPIEVGDLVKLLLVIDEGSEAMEAQGRVVRVELGRDASLHPETRTVGVSFEPPLPELEAAVKELAERQATLYGRSSVK